MSARNILRRIAIGCARVLDVLHVVAMVGFALLVILSMAWVALLAAFFAASLVVDGVAARVGLIAAAALFAGLAAYGREIDEVSR